MVFATHNLATCFVAQVAPVSTPVFGALQHSAHSLGPTCDLMLETNIMQVTGCIEHEGFDIGQTGSLRERCCQLIYEIAQTV